EAFLSQDLQKISYFEKVGNSEDRDFFRRAINNVRPQANPEEQIILMPHSGAFAQRTGRLLLWAWLVYGVGPLIIFGMIAYPELDEDKLVEFWDTSSSEEVIAEIFSEMPDARGTYWGTVTLIIANLLVFIILAFYGLDIASPSSQELLAFGGLRGQEVIQGEYWRVISSLFIHAGIIHLVLAIIALVFISRVLEKLIGSWKLLLIYLISGLAGNFLTIHAFGERVSSGSFGAIFGLFGLLFCFAFHKTLAPLLRDHVWIFLAVLGFGSIFLGSLVDINHAAHLGGFMSGFFIGLLILILEKKID
ncbi:MAG: rhomboid family intramembrane serine protease, partial [Bacteroidota bacterium]